MSVDIYAIALKTYSEWRPGWGDTGPRTDGDGDVWFGDGKYTEEQERLYALAGRQLTDELIAELCNWPREAAWDEEDQASLEKFLEAHRGKYLDFYAG